ncbi:phosphotransferase family protein [Aspergillus campestris IBT 28561]|uniref:Altered inheritance of mitochondria protein 9, mitochondrial n=1 Tax=Aspergillus campestris (strain IBT 28561) TaxID=1392248 RepID=A0A2I1DC53_ASPC2|nr:phosphotransferase family protein [Aspergillus campestris IBT 28561]PKY07456.1 phosphotransferase family protein [Aspergillus campestris IBT 28561]
MLFPRMLNRIRHVFPILRRETVLLPLSSQSYSHPSRPYSHQHPQHQIANIVGSPHDFFRYTSGRWLWDEAQRLEERHREFDILELQKIAMGLSSSESCISMEKIGEGSYNKSFKLTMDNGKTVVARIPNPNAGPAFLTTASEVATMDFLRNILHVPVPEVLAWNAAVDSLDPVGAEYIIMEHALGKNLADAWTDMDIECKIQTMNDIVAVQQKLLSLRFSEYGCLFYKKDAPSGSHPAIVEGDVSRELKHDIAEKFSIGPMVDTAFWNNGRGDMDIYCGPWGSAVDYMQAPALREIAWIQNHAVPRSPDDPLFVSHSQNDPAEHVALLQRYLDAAPHLIPQEADISGSYLWHTDLRTPNIFVDDRGHITSIIDWQSTCAGPLFLHGRHPHFLDYKDELIFKLPENFKQMDEDTKSVTRDKLASSILVYRYEKYTAERNPLLDKVLRYPNGKTLSHPISFVGNTWDEDIIPLRESLIRIQRDWNLLNRSTQCPIDFSPEEIRKHYEDGEDWNELQDFWDALSGVMARDGWTSYVTYDEAVSVYSQIQATQPSTDDVVPGRN